MSSDKFLITKMLNNLRNTRTSVKMQMATISDVLDKSNNVLLQIEATRCTKPGVNADDKPYTYNKESVNALTKIVDKFDLSNERPTESSNFEEYLEATGQIADYLGCNIRKLLAIWDTIQQMRAVLQRVESEISSENESEEDCF